MYRAKLRPGESPSAVKYDRSIAACRNGRGCGAYPKVIWDIPPGGATTRVEGRSVSTFPQFWLAPLAYRFEDCAFATAPKACCCCGATILAGAFASLPPMDRDDWLGSRRRTFSFTGMDVVSSLPQPRLNVEPPPGGAWILVEERPVITLPQFWLAPFAYAFMETDIVFAEEGGLRERKRRRSQRKRGNGEMMCLSDRWVGSPGWEECWRLGGE